MKVNSIWQPYATLAARGFKTIETKIWPVPSTILGKRIGIASTKTIKPEQRATLQDPEFLEYYSRLGLPLDIEELPHGYLLGTVIIDSCELVTEELLEEISEEEQMYGWYQVPERSVYAWRLRDPQPLAHPIPIRGAQGIYEWNGVLPDGKADQKPEARDEAAEARLLAAASDAPLRRHLRIVE